MNRRVSTLTILFKITELQIFGNFFPAKFEKKCIPVFGKCQDLENGNCLFQRVNSVQLNPQNCSGNDFDSSHSYVCFPIEKQLLFIFKHTRRHVNHLLGKRQRPTPIHFNLSSKHFISLILCFVLFGFTIAFSTISQFLSLRLFFSLALSFSECVHSSV